MRIRTDMGRLRDLLWKVAYARSKERHRVISAVRLVYDGSVLYARATDGHRAVEASQLIQPTGEELLEPSTALIPTFVVDELLRTEVKSIVQIDFDDPTTTTITIINRDTASYNYNEVDWSITINQNSFSQIYPAFPTCPITYKFTIEARALKAAINRLRKTKQKGITLTIAGDQPGVPCSAILHNHHHHQSLRIANALLPDTPIAIHININYLYDAFAHLDPRTMVQVSIGGLRDPIGLWTLNHDFIAMVMPRSEP